MEGSRSVVDLADRIVDPRRASIGCAAVLLAFVALADPAAHYAYETLDAVPRARAALRANADPEVPRAAAVPLEPLIVLLLDGMRLDESRRSAPIEALRDRGASGVVELTEVPTLSRPYYHALLTGVPQRGSGVRRNRPGQRQVFDALPDRVRAAGGEVAIIAEDLDWMSVLYARDSDVDHHGADALEEPLSRVLARVSAGDGPTFTLIHLLAIDETAHDHGIDSDEHRAALDRGDALVSRVAEAAFGRAHLAVVSDHGHIAVGGHGGDEPEVRLAPFVLVGEHVSRRRIERRLAVEELAATFASYVGVAPPRSAVANAIPEVAGPYILEGPQASRRAALMEAATDAERAARIRRWGWLLPLTVLLSLMGLGATKRSFGRLDAGTFVAPALVAASVALVHRYVLDRPFTLSALDHATTQGYRVAAIAALSSAIAIPTAALVARSRRGEPFAMHVRRAAAGTGWAALTFTVWVIAAAGGSLGPWPPTAFDVYAPILAFAGGGGAAVVAAIALISTIFRRSPSASASPVDREPAL